MKIATLCDYLPPTSVDTVVYHSPCADGFAAAYCFWKLRRDGVLTFIPYSHQSPPSDLLERIKAKNVAFVDLCPTNIEDCILEANRLIVLDHHESATRVLSNVNATVVSRHCHFDMNHSGAVLAHQYCFPDQKVPFFIRCIEDRDIWAWQIPESRAFNEVLHGQPFDFETYSQYESDGAVNRAVDEGRIMLHQKDLQVDSIAKRATRLDDVTVSGKHYTIKIVNSNQYISEVGNELARDVDFAVIWYYDHETRQVIFSFRSMKDKANVSLIAETFGGGGHPCASGCRQMCDFHSQPDADSAIGTFLVS